MDHGFETSGPWGLGNMRIVSSNPVYSVRRIYPAMARFANLVVARDTFKTDGGMLRTSDALRFGIQPRTLYTLRDSGELVLVGRGLYRLATAPAVTHADWADSHETPREQITALFNSHS
jgi:hypothetical protein